MPHNLVPTTVWTTPIPVPSDGDVVTADSALAGDGPINPAVQALANRTHALGQGTATVKALTADGTGEQAVTPVAGTVNASRTIISATYPTPGANPLQGEFIRDSALAAAAACEGGFIPPLGGAGQGLYDGFGIHDLVRNGAGDYNVTFRRVPTGVHTSVVTATGAVGSGGTEVTKSLDGGGRLVARVTFANAADLNFDIMALIW